MDSVANILSTFSQTAELRLVPRSGAEFTGPVVGRYDSSDESWGRQVHLGPLTYGQPRDIVVPMKIPAGKAPYLEATLTYPHLKKTIKVVG